MCIHISIHYYRAAVKKTLKIMWETVTGGFTMANTKGRVQSILAGSLIAAGLAFATSATAGTIIGSKHDFAAQAWNSSNEICIVCHTPHNSSTIPDAPLWNHEVTTSTFTTYTSPSFDGAGTIGQPDGSSVLCLSCHDGTVAVDSYGGAAGGGFTLTGRSNLGTDLSNDHPISFTYDAALATADPGLFDPTTKTITIGEGDKQKTGTIDDVMLLSGKLQCASCHDVHNGFTQGPATTNKLLRVNRLGSQICLACHNK